MKPKAGQWLLIAFKCERHQKIEILILHAETARHHTSNSARLGIDGDAAPNDGEIAAKLPLPVTIAEHHALRPVRNLIGCRQQPPSHWRNAQRFQYAVA